MKRCSTLFIIQFSSVTQSCLTLCDPMDCNMPRFPVHHQLAELTQTGVRWFGDAIQPSHPLLPPCPPALNSSEHQGLFQRVSSSHQVAKVLEFQLQHQSFQWIFRTVFLQDWLVWSPLLSKGLSSIFSSTTVQKHALLIIRELQMGTVMGYHHTPHRRAISRTPTTANVGKNVEKGQPPCTVDGNVNWNSHYGEKYGDSLKNKLGINWPYDPTIPLLGMFPEETTSDKDACTAVFYLQ